VPLLEEMERADMPIDMIAGVSFGAIAGAAYAAQGAEGLRKLIAARYQLTLLASVAPLSSQAVAHVLLRQGIVGNLEDLEVPFYPIAVEIVSGREEVFTHGSIAQAVRASSSLPGIFGSTVVGNKRYVDGCVAANVPASCLMEQGADFVIASNVVCGQSVHQKGSSQSGIAGLINRFSPLVRMSDAVRALYIMLHDMGARQAACAHVTFAPDLMGFLPFDFHRADRIAERAREETPRFLADVRKQYQAFAHEVRMSGSSEGAVAAVTPA
jgi:NTE family protein